MPEQVVTEVRWDDIEFVDLVAKDAFAAWLFRIDPLGTRSVEAEKAPVSLRFNIHEREISRVLGMNRRSDWKDERSKGVLVLIELKVGEVVGDSSSLGRSREG